eukprot:7757603-Karenia_brevis.AAC.1
MGLELKADHLQTKLETGKYYTVPRRDPEIPQYLQLGDASEAAEAGTLSEKFPFRVFQYLGPRPENLKLVETCEVVPASFILPAFILEFEAPQLL